ncbi:flippase [Chloroflexus aggregans]|uniref:Polysaccharide biosynthesis protein n=1 Tax=Chloroflexus aggregans (strain MD-66 / DSM 9485) TaxID=326427 RepID=B8G5K9_CHLAD|nr:flippase [Chloroflexus aggregans]ACL23720.1 polysaccharide biosynthesis protein [Chloroflexus aggregans DSM 9485]
MMNSLVSTVLRNSVAGMIAQLAIKVLSFCFSIFIVRQLGATDFGQYAAVIGFGSVFLFIADLGLAPYTVREVARLRSEPDHIERIRNLYADILALRLILALIAGTLVVSAAIVTERPWLMVGAIALNGLILLIYAIHGSSEAVLAGYERLDLTAGMQVVNQFIFVTLGGIALWLGFGYYGLIIATMLGVATMTALVVRALWRLGIRPGRQQRTRWVSLLRAAFPFGVIGLTLGLSYRFDTVVLNVSFGDSATGYYNAAYNLIFALVTLSNVVNTALYPSLSRQAKTDPANLPRIYERILSYLMIVALPLTAGGFILADPLTHFLFGEEYAATAPLLATLIWVLPLMFVTEFLGYVVVIADREALVARSIMISTGFNVIANIVFTTRYGTTAAALITVVTEAVLAVQYAWLLRDRLRLMRWQPIGRAVIAVGLMAVAVYVAREWPVLLVIAGGGAIYGGLLIGLRVIGVEETSFVRNLLAARR